MGHLPNAESVPEFQNHLSASGPHRSQGQVPPKPMMTPPTIHLPVTVPGAMDTSGVKRGKAYKSSLASSLSNMMAQLDR